MKILEKAGKSPLFFDGAMGTELQKYNVISSDRANITNPDDVYSVHKKYIAAGADIILTNTFGIFFNKYDKVEEIISKAFNIAKTAISESGRKVYTAFDMGPSVYSEYGDCYDIFKKGAVLGEKYGADLAFLETFSDICEIKTAILAVKENTNLPVFCTMTYDKDGKTLKGCDILTMINVLEELEVSALGVNCGFGPVQAEILLEEIVKYTSKPVIVKPNAGLPRFEEGKAVYGLSPLEFAESMERMYRKGAVILGGCCGTTPAHIEKTVEMCKS